MLQNKIPGTIKRNLNIVQNQRFMMVTNRSFQTRLIDMPPITRLTDSQMI